MLKIRSRKITDFYKLYQPVFFSPVHGISYIRIVKGKKDEITIERKKE